MRVLILGNGAREHALAWKFSQSRRLSGLYVAPGNAGTAELGTNLPELDTGDPGAVVGHCKENGINFVFIGGETLLAAGMVDALAEAGIAAIGPEKHAARLEASKAFAKQFMLRHGIPTAHAQTFTDVSAFQSYLEQATARQVLKKSGLAAGKGVLESEDRDTLLEFGRRVLEHDSLLVEEYCSGFEISVFAVTDGRTYRLLPPCTDYKKSGEGNTGLNTGGMGSLCPVPWLDQEMERRIDAEVVAPTFEGLHRDGLAYRGVLYFGLMITESGPLVLEYNVRFGDPEAQVLLPLLKTDLGSLSEVLVQGNLASLPLQVSEATCIGIVVASEGYPGEYRKGVPVRKLPELGEDQLLFHAATYREGATVYTGGGRCFTVVGLGRDVLQARARAYNAVSGVEFDGAWYRNDIGGRIFGQ